MNGTAPSSWTIAGRVLVMTLAYALLIASFGSCFILMIASNLGAHGPSPWQFVIEFWRLPAAVLLAALALWAAVRGRAGRGFPAALLSAVALADQWWPILR